MTGNIESARGKFDIRLSLMILAPIVSIIAALLLYANYQRQTHGLSVTVYPKGPSNYLANELGAMFRLLSKERKCEELHFFP
jgi:ATP/ADP translocase